MIPRLVFSVALLVAAATTTWQGAAAQMTGAQMSQEQVRIIQSRLAALGFDPGVQDGVWGEQTATALRNFQAAHGIEANGEPGDLALRMLGISTAVERAGRS
jgi:peptidoglycan hydrolase-like protein with peptidoglycan-binding domain